MYKTGKIPEREFTSTFAPHNIGIFGAYLPKARADYQLSGVMHAQLFFPLGREVDKPPSKVPLTNRIPDTLLTPGFFLQAEQ